MPISANPLDTPATRKLAERFLDLLDRYVTTREIQAEISRDKWQRQLLHEADGERILDQQDRHLTIQEERLAHQREKWLVENQGRWPGVDLDESPE